MSVSDPLKKVKSGQKLHIPAATFNTFVDTARDYLDRKHGQGQQATPAGQRNGIILVKNAAAKSPTLQSHGDGAAIVKKPVAVYVEQVYEYGDFSLLGIGT